MSKIHPVKKSVNHHLSNNITPILLVNANFHKDYSNNLWEYRKVVADELEFVVRIWLSEDKEESVYYNECVVNKGTNEIYANYYNEFGNNEVVRKARKNIENTYKYLIKKNIFTNERD